jgi:hypothetical protein
LALALLALGGLRVLQAQEEARTGPSTVTLDLKGTAISEALTEIGKQTHWEIHAAADLTGEVTLKVDAVHGETALDQVVQQRNGRWLRLYLVGKLAEQVPAWEAKELIQFLMDQQRDRILHLPFEKQQGELLRNIFAFRPNGADRGGQPAGQPQAGEKFPWDPLRPFRAAEYHEQVDLSVQNATLLSALDALWGASGHPVVAEEDLKGQVSVEAKQEALEGVLDKLCTPLNLKWRRAYLAVPLEELTRDELGQRMNQGWNMMWDSFFALDAPARQQWLQWGISMLKSIPPAQVAQIRQSQFAPRMVEAATQLVTRLNAQQRREVAPLAQMLLSVFGGQ